MVRWEHYLWSDDLPLDMEKVRAFQAQNDIVFPSDYLAILSQNQGKTPNPAEIQVGKVVTVVSCLLHFACDEYSSYQMEETLALFLGNGYPARVIPFADSPGGDCFCFDFRAVKDRPTIVLNCHEYPTNDSTIPVAPSFAEFIHKLGRV